MVDYNTQFNIFISEKNPCSMCGCVDMGECMFVGMFGCVCGGKLQTIPAHLREAGSPEVTWLEPEVVPESTRLQDGRHFGTGSYFPARLSGTCSTIRSRQVEPTRYK